MKEAIRSEIVSSLGSLQLLRYLLPEAGEIDLEKANKEMNKLISQDFEPYFSGNAALHLAASCQRCGRCCKDERAIALSIEDCRRMARHLDLSLKKFMLDYTRPHELKGEEVGNARMMRKEEEMPCPFYLPDLPGCGIHQFKPQVCSAAFYLSKMNLLLCHENRKFSTFPNCPADRELRAKIREMGIKLREDPGTMRVLVGTLQSDLAEVGLFRLLLRLKGMEIYFGKEKSSLLARQLGLKRIPADKELRPAALLYALMLLEVQEMG